MKKKDGYGEPVCERGRQHGEQCVREKGRNRGQSVRKKVTLISNLLEGKKA